MRFILQLFLLAPLATAFLTPPMARKPGLAELVETQADQRLKINLDIGKDGEASRLAIKGMVLDLVKENAEYDHIKMPGKDGPHPKLSAGIRTLNVIKDGEFINQMGTQLVKTLKGAWEFVWRKDAPAGALLCGFEIPEEYKRNDATLPKGRIYLSFPIWTKETLAYAQSEKERILNRAKDILEEKEQQLTKVRETANPLMKALHLRNAYAALEKYSFQPIKQMEQVPGNDEVVAIQDDLFVTTKGLVWSKSLPRGEQILLGTANLAALTEG